MDLLELKGVMSEGYGFIPKKVMRDKTINIISKSIYAYLCSYSGKGTIAFPSQSLICHDLSISKGTLSKYLKELKDKGYIKVEQKRDKGNRYRSNVYSIELMPCTVSPYTERAVTDETVNGQIDTNNNNFNNNNFNNNNLNTVPKRKNFKIPTVEEISAYCKERNNNINAEQFFDYYESKGWLVGKTKMKDWKASVRTWERNSINKPKPNNSKIYGKGKEQEYLDSIGEW